LADQGVADATLFGQDHPTWSEGWPAGWWPGIELVVEGQAKNLPNVPGIKVIAAPGEGDNQIVEQAALACQASGAVAGLVVVATADKALAARVKAVGAKVVPPGRLLRVL